jgi:hypothetical protein
VLKVKRLVAACFVEAAKTTLEHLGTYRLSLSQEGTAGPPDLARTYGDVRRLRDFLQRCANVGQDEIELDMADADKRLLVACCRRSVEVMDLGLSGPRPLSADVAILMRKKRQIVADWALELASHPLLELPLNQLSNGQPQASRALLVRLQQKAKAEKLEQQRALELAREEEVPQNEAMIKVDFGIEDYGTAIDEPVGPPPIDTVSARPAPAASTNLLDTSKVHDPRLRAVIATDLASYAHCVAGGDLRLAEVLLACVVESALLDHVLPRRTEFGLSGPPETWNLKQLLIRVMGERCTARDRSLVAHLFSARTLLRPAVQMVAPSSVTPESFESLREFVQRVLTTDLDYSDDCTPADASRNAPARDPSAQ